MAHVERSDAQKRASAENLKVARAVLADPSHAWTRSERTAAGNRGRRWKTVAWAVAKLDRTREPD